MTILSKLKVRQTRNNFFKPTFLPKNERKQVNMKFHSSKVEFLCSFLGRNVGLKKSFRLCLTFMGSPLLLSCSVYVFTDKTQIPNFTNVSQLKNKTKILLVRKAICSVLSTQKNKNIQGTSWRLEPPGTSKNLQEPPGTFWNLKESPEPSRNLQDALGSSKNL